MGARVRRHFCKDQVLPQSFEQRQSDWLFNIQGSLGSGPARAGSGSVNIWFPHSVDLGELLRPPREGLVRVFFRDMVDGRVPLPRTDMLKWYYDQKVTLPFLFIFRKYVL